MARVIAFVPDLLFGSNVVGGLRASGHEVRLVAALEDVSLGDAGIDGEIVHREVRTGRAETVQMWGRTESVRREFRKLNTF